MREVQVPRSLYGLPIVGYGMTGLVIELDEHTVIKQPVGEDGWRDHQIERRIYTRLGSHPRIVQVISHHRVGLVMEKLGHPLRLRLMNLRQEGKLPSAEEILRWSSQTAEGLQYLHEKNIFQCDVGCHNILLDSKDDVKICDFAGSSIDGEKAEVLPSSHSQYPMADHNAMVYPTVRSEVFALGAVIYEISTTLQPYHDKGGKEIERLYAAGKFPATASLLLGDVILKCWTCQYASAGEVVTDIRRAETDRPGLKMSRFWSDPSVLVIVAAVVVIAFRTPIRRLVIPGP